MSKPISDRKLKANRRNAAKSTGPKTPEGKAHSGQNALKHGLRAAKPENAVPDDMRRTYAKFRAQYLDEYRPSGATENTLLDMVILAAWQLYRIREMELFAPIELASPFSSSSFGKSDRLARYRASYERMFHLNLNQLKQIQQERLLLAADRAARDPEGARLRPALDEPREPLGEAPRLDRVVDHDPHKIQAAVGKLHPRLTNAQPAVPLDNLLRRRRDHHRPDENLQGDRAMRQVLDTG